jgi:hypothetical protein
MATATYTPLASEGAVKATILGDAYTDDLDAAAVIAVAESEGGLTPAPGHYDPDTEGNPGWSYGPFQLRDPGKLPISSTGASGPGEAFAWSTTGIGYAVDGMVPVAAGLSGKDAINALVSGFEHPADVAGEEQRAFTYYEQLTGGKGDTPQVPRVTDPITGGGGVTVAGPNGTQSGPSSSGLLGGLGSGIEGDVVKWIAYLVLTLAGVALVGFGLFELLGYSPSRVAGAVSPIAAGQPGSSKLAKGEEIPF